MTLKLYYHPLASFCWKALIALYENDTPFEAILVDLADPQSAADFKAVWPMGKFPVLVDTERDRTVPESSIIIEYLARHFPGPSELVPADPDLARQARLRDRIFDQYVHEPMQKIVLDNIRPDGMRDPFGVAAARAQLVTALDMLEEHMAGQEWALAEGFGLADCAAAPALFYADKAQPFGRSHPSTMAYLERLKARPSFARVLAEAEPYFAMFPG